MGPAPYIPADQAGIDTWMQNFSALISGSPATYGLTSVDASVIATFTGTYNVDLNVAVNPGTRTPMAVAAKDASKSAALVICRGYAIQIRNNAGVSNADKTALGLTIPSQTPTPIVRPTTNPILGIVGCTPLEVTMKYSDSATPTTKAKPFGAKSLEMHAVTSLTVISDPNVIPYVGDYTKAPFALQFLSGDVGKVAYICGRWKTQAGAKGGLPALVGPWSSIVSTVVVG